MTVIEELWFKPLEDYPQSALDWAFRDYVANGVDEKGRFFFPVPAQIGSRCQAYIERNQGEPRRSLLGCDHCRANGTGNGFVWADEKHTKLNGCVCRTNPSLRSAPPEVDRMDLGDVKEQVFGKSAPELGNEFLRAGQRTKAEEK